MMLQGNTGAEDAQALPDEVQALTLQERLDTGQRFARRKMHAVVALPLTVLVSGLTDYLQLLQGGSSVQACMHSLAMLSGSSALVGLACMYARYSVCANACSGIVCSTHAFGGCWLGTLVCPQRRMYARIGAFMFLFVRSCLRCHG